MTNVLRKIMSFCHSDSEKIVLTAVLLLYKEQICIGRMKASKTLNLTERKVRTAINKLLSANLLIRRGYDICLNHMVAENIPNIRRVKANSKAITILYNVSEDVVKEINKNILRIRDNIVIYTRDPEALEVLGYKIGSRIVIPRLEDEQLLNHYLSLLRRVNVVSDKFFFVVWRKYRPYIYDSVALLSINNIMNSYRHA